MAEYTALIAHTAEKYLSLLGKDFDVLPLPSDTRLDVPVAAHTDMNLFVLGNTVVLSKDYAETNPFIVSYLKEVCALDTILSDGERRREYPYDVMLNVLVSGNVCFSLKEHTADEVKELITRNNMLHVNVKQGYAACSALAFGTSIITADRSIQRATEALGIECLLISGGGIRLDGYSEGFIGGSSGVCGNKIYFTGNVKLHPDGEKILRFVEKGGFEAVSLSEDILTDVGGIRFLKNIRSLK